MIPRIERVTEDEITASDLREELGPREEAVECYRVTLYRDDAGTIAHPETAQAVYVPDLGRLGIAWGGYADWIDAHDAEIGIADWAAETTD